MLDSPEKSFCVPSCAFEQIRELLEQMIHATDSTGVVLTEAIFARFPVPREWRSLLFTLVVSPKFNALLVGTRPGVMEEISHRGQPQAQLSVNINLTFEPEEIAAFCLNLRSLFETDSHTYKQLEKYCQQIAPNDATIQNKFTLILLKRVLSQLNQPVVTPPAITYDPVSVCQPVEAALQKQIAQEQLLNRVTTQIRKSLDLQVIMATAVAQVREFLNLDRLVVYKFEQSIENNSTTDDATQYQGYIIYEVLANDTIKSVLNYQEKHCFSPNSKFWLKYRQGFSLAISDVEKSYALEECLLNFLRTIQVRAKFAAPIVFENKLWGLLIAHQCDYTRDWSENERNLLTNVAEQLAIAIHQAELMHSLTQEKQTLAQRVNERTIELHDALIAAESASRLKSEFLATISHELLTPLTYVIGMSSTLLRWSFGELTQRQRNYLQTIHDSGERLLSMINNILELSQVEAGKAVLNISEFSLTSIAEKIFNDLKTEAANQQINFRLDLQIDPDRDLFHADVRRVQQIISNLLNNAIKFTPQAGEVTLRLWVEDLTAVLQVEDNGIGIPEAQRSLLFEKFHQLDTPYRRNYQGTGMGLALTKQLVELHRGRIDVQSSVGVGSIFTVWIPSQSE